MEGAQRPENPERHGVTADNGNPTNDPRPLGGATISNEVNEFVKSRVEGDAPGRGQECSQQQPTDEVDLTPEEQFTRHHVEFNTDKLRQERQHPHEVPSERGPLEVLKEKAGHVVHAAKAAVEHTLQGVTSNLSSEENSKQMRERLNPSSDPDPPEFPPTLQDAISDARISDDPLPESTKPLPGSGAAARPQSKL